LPLIIGSIHITEIANDSWVTQEALDLNYDGMIIETHIDPDNAWVTAQVTDALKKFYWFESKKVRWCFGWVYTKMKN
jgi:chorismate mutase